MSYTCVLKLARCLLGCRGDWKLKRLATPPFVAHWPWDTTSRPEMAQASFKDTIIFIYVHFRYPIGLEYANGQWVGVASGWLSTVLNQGVRRFDHCIYMRFQMGRLVQICGHTAHEVGLNTFTPHSVPSLQYEQPISSMLPQLPQGFHKWWWDVAQLLDP